MELKKLKVEVGEAEGGGEVNVNLIILTPPILLIQVQQINNNNPVTIFMLDFFTIH